MDFRIARRICPSGWAACLAASILLAALMCAMPAAAQAKSMDAYIGLNKKVLVIATAKGDNSHYKRIYRQPKASSKKISKLQGRSCVVVDTSKMKKGKDYRFVKVLLPNCKPSKGYVRVKDFTFDTIDTRTFDLKSTKGKQAKMRIKACKHALTFVGSRYSHANSTNPRVGLNCRHLVLRAYNKAGCKVYASSPWIFNQSRYGKRIPREKLKAGDTVFYKDYHGAPYGHMALYIGKGYVVQSSCDKGRTYPTAGVRITKLRFRSYPELYRNVIGTYLG